MSPERRPHKAAAFLNGIVRKSSPPCLVVVKKMKRGSPKDCPADAA